MEENDEKDIIVEKYKRGRDKVITILLLYFTSIYFIK